MKWLFLYVVILIKRSSTTNATQMPSTSSHSSISQEMHAIGVGAINEKQRLYQPSSSTYTTNNNDDSMQETNAIGGGAINEKRRLYQQSSSTYTTTNNDDSTSNNDSTNDTSWKPNEYLSHMLHALVGLDRYPNYLNRISDIDTLALEKALESKLSDVRKQRAEINQRRADIKQLVRRYMMDKSYIVEDEECTASQEIDILWKNHPLLSPPKDWIDLSERNILQEVAFKVAYQSTNKKRKSKSKKDSTQLSITDIMEGKVQVDLKASLLEDLLQQEMYDVYSIPLLTPEFCNILRTTLRELSQLAETNDFAHLQLGRRVIDLDTIGLGWITDLLFHMYIKPISQHLFAQTEKLVASDSDSSSILLDWRQGYVAGYSAQPSESKGATRHRLVPHTDDAEVTLNCCLGEENYEGGSVEFYGLRGTEEEGQLIGVARRPNVGTALLHSGRHLHAVESVSKGDRYALIIWTRSWMNIRSVACPCCWLNRRQDSTCICNQRWN